MTRKLHRAETSEAPGSIRRVWSFHYWIIIEGAVVGFFSGVFVSILRLLMHHAESVRTTLLQQISSHPIDLAILALILVACYLVSILSVRIAPLASGSGIPQIKGELQGQVDEPWLSILITKIAGTIAGIGAGLSMGNEGPSVQIGAMTGKGVARLTCLTMTEEHILMTAGVGAGLSCAFNAPLAAIMFVVEDIQNNLNKDIILATMAAVVTSNVMSYRVFGLHPVVTLAVDRALPLRYYWLLIILGVILGVFGVAFNRFTDVMQNVYSRISMKSVRMAIPFLLVIPVAYFIPDALGTGYGLIGEAATGKFAAQALLALIAVKFFYSMTCTTSGVPGGIFLPLLVIGALTGGLFLDIYSGISGDTSLYLANFVLYGMTGYFASIIRAPITGVLLITEMTGNFNNFLSLMSVALVSYIAAQLLHGQPIYEQLLHRMLRTKNESIHSTGRVPKIIVEFDVCSGSAMDGQPLSKINLPKGSLVVSVLHQGVEFVPGGNTVLHGGDKLSVVCAVSDALEVDRVLDERCHQIQNPS